MGGALFWWVSTGRTRIGVLTIIILLGVPPGSAAADTNPVSPVVPTIEAQEVQTVWTAPFGVPHPSGLAYVTSRDEFLVAADQETGTAVVRLSRDEDPLGSLQLRSVADPATLVYDGSTDRITVIEGGERIDMGTLSLDAEDPGTRRSELPGLDHLDPESAAIDPATGATWLLASGSNDIVRITGRSSASNVDRIALDPIVDAHLVAFNTSDGLLYVLDGQDMLHGLNETGDVQKTFDLASVELHDPVAMVFAPSADATDDPGNQNLYIADAGELEAQGGITEVSLNVVAAATVPVDTATLVQSIATSSWKPASPDPSGVVYLPGPDELLVVDSEVDEVTGAGWHDVNMWRLRRSGNVVGVGTFWGPNAAVFSGVTGYSREPTGVGFDPSSNTLFVSDDGARKIFVVRPGNDGNFGTSDDIVGAINASAYGSTDTEDPEFDVTTGHLFFLDGVGMEIFRVDPIDGVFGNGNDLMTHFDISHLGPTDFEGLASNPSRGTLYVGARKTKQIFEITKNGTLLREISATGVSGLSRISGLGVAPASDGSGRMNFWIADRAVDNGSSSTENDGRVFEITAPDSLGGSTNQAPVVNAGADQTVTLPNSANLNGTVTDDGLPAGATVTQSWSAISVPAGATVTFANPNQAATTATFSHPGTYVLRLTATDTQLTAADDVTIVVTDTANQAPVVNAGADQTVTLPNSANLNGAVTDDGLPAGATVTQSWSAISVPAGATLTFANPNQVVTTATFSHPGTYVLRLTATDTQLTAADDVTVRVAGEHRAIGQSTRFGIVTGELADTYVDDGRFQGIGEVPYAGGGRARLEHTWSFELAGGDTVELVLNAFRSGAETFVFDYSTDGRNWTTMVTVTATQDGTEYRYALPPGTSGTVWVRAMDSNRGRGDTVADVISVDRLVIISRFN
jgi:hypothetical protein